MNDGGQAFPYTRAGDGVSVPGMSRRDWFAGQALAYVGPVQLCGIQKGHAMSAEKVVAMAFEIADEMLVESLRKRHDKSGADA